jgi:hypothetical protein
MKKKKLLIIPDGFSIFQSRSDLSQYYAMSDEELKTMDEILIKFQNENIPDEYTVKVKKIGKVGEKDPETDLYDFVEQNPIEHRYNDLIPIAYELLF